MKDNYRAIVRKTTKNAFKYYIDCLDIPSIDYVAIGIQHVGLKKSLSLMSNTEWQKIFTRDHYAKHDPIRKATLLTQRNIIGFSELDHCDAFGKFIMKQRASHGIKNGIIFMKRLREYNYMLTLGTGFSGFDAYRFLKNNYERIDVAYQDLINIIAKDARHFIYQTRFTHLCSDAK